MQDLSQDLQRAVQDVSQDYSIGLTQLQLLETVYNEGQKKPVILTDKEKAFDTIQDPFVIIK